MSAPKPLNPNLVTTREMLVLGEAAVYSIAEVEAAAEDTARLDWLEASAAEVTPEMIEGEDEDEDLSEGWAVYATPAVSENQRCAVVSATAETLRAAIDAARKEAL